MGEWDSIAGLAGMLGDRKEGFLGHFCSGIREQCVAATFLCGSQMCFE